MSASSFPPASMIGEDACPRLARGVRLRRDRLTGKFLLLRPETGFELRGSALDIVRLCDGTTTVESIVDQLARTHGDTGRPRIAEDVARLLDELLARRLIDLEGERVEGELKDERSAP